MGRLWPLLALSIFFAATARAELLTGVARMTDLWQLPQIELGVRTFGTSSFDRAGLNDDGFTGLSSRLYWQDGMNILFDAEGPGCVYRIWFTGLFPFSHLRFYVDDQTEPIVNDRLPDFFAGQLAPFTPPLVWDQAASSGGFVSYVPICYQKRLVIGATIWTFFYNITAQAYRGDTTVTSFTGTEDYSTVRRLYDPAAAGTDPKNAAGVTLRQTQIQIPPGATTPIFSQTGAGQIASLRFKPASLDAALLTSVRLTAAFDGGSPTVDIPLGLFFGASRPDSTVSALLFGVRDGVLYSFFPMPFFTGVQLALANDSAAPVALDVEVGWTSRPPDDYAGTFETVHQVSDPTVIGRDYQFASLTGQGKMVGVVHVAAGRSGPRFLEGNETFWADGQRSPSIQGTGTEDYYNAGWYFKHGPFTLPTHGAPEHYLGPDGDTYDMYRVQAADALEFYDGATFAIQHDAFDEYNDEAYRSCVFAYRVNEAALVPADEFGLADAADRQRVGYHGTADAPVGPNSFVYEGTRPPEVIVDSGVRSTGAARFTMRVNPFNDGVRLVRRIDQGQGRQAVNVSVNGVAAGVWRSPERNKFKRWRDAVFDLPPALTKGHATLEISLDNALPGRAFTQYRYWVLNWKRPLLTRLTDLAVRAAKTQIRVGEEIALAAAGHYSSGAAVDVSGWSEFRLSNPALARVECARFRALAPGTVYVLAAAGPQTSPAVKIVILPASASDDDDDDDDSPGPATSDLSAAAEHGGCGC